MVGRIGERLHDFDSEVPVFHHGSSRDADGIASVKQGGQLFLEHVHDGTFAAGGGGAHQLRTQGRLAGAGRAGDDGGRAALDPAV